MSKNSVTNPIPIGEGEICMFNGTIKGKPYYGHVIITPVKRMKEDENESDIFQGTINGKEYKGYVTVIPTDLK